MPIAIVGDPTIQAPSTYNYISKKGILKNRILDASLKALRFTIDNSQGCRDIILLGDIFELKDRIPSFIKNKFIEAIEYATIKKKKNVYVLVGNHDIAPDGHISIRWLNAYATIIYEPEVIRINNKEILMLPYTTDIDQLERVLQKSKADYCCAHIDVKDINIGCYRSKNGVRLELFKKFKKVFLGHIHNSFSSISDNYIVVGSPYQTDWSELDRKRFIILDNNKVTSVSIVPYVNRTIVPIIEAKDLERFNSMDLKDKYIRIDISQKMTAYIDDIQKKLKESTYFCFNHMVLDYSTNESARNLDKKTIGSLIEDFIQEQIAGIEKNKSQYLKVIRNIVKRGSST